MRSAGCDIRFLIKKSLIIRYAHSVTLGNYGAIIIAINEIIDRILTNLQFHSLFA